MKKIVIINFALMLILNINTGKSNSSKRDNFIKIFQINNDLNIKRGLSLSKIEFINNDTKMIIADNCWRIFVYDLINHKIDFTLREDNLKGKWCFSEEGYYNQFAISSNEKYIAIGDCIDKGKMKIKIFNLITYAEISTFDSGLEPQGAPPDLFDLDFISDNNKIRLLSEFADSLNKIGYIVKAWDIKAQQKILDKEIITNNFLKCYFSFSFIDLNLMVYDCDNFIKIYSLSNMNLVDEIKESKEITLDLWTKNYLFYFVEEYQKCNSYAGLRQLNYCNKISSIKYYDLIKKTKSFIITGLYNPEIHNFIKNRILIIEEKKIKSIINKSNKIEYKIYEKRIRYYDILSKRLIANKKINPSCYLSISKSGNIWFLSCASKDNIKNYYIAYPNLKLKYFE